MRTQMKMRAAAVAVAILAPGLALADSYSATVVAGHPGVFRWVKMIDEAPVTA